MNVTNRGCGSLGWTYQKPGKIEVGPAWRSSLRDARILKTIRYLLNGCNLATTTLKVIKLKEVDLL